jgi:hypothetical protein
MRPRSTSPPATSATATSRAAPCHSSRSGQRCTVTS